MTRKFLFGAVLGAFAVYWWIHHAPAWMGKGSSWIGGTANEYRGDDRHRKANDALR